MTYGTIKTRIADDLARSDLTSQIATAVLNAIKHYERRRFYFNTRVATDTFALVANQEYYGSADLAVIPNLITIDDMYATVGGVRYHILPTTFEGIAEAQDGLLTRDPPFNYAYHAQQIRMYPIPSAARTVTMATHYRLTALSADGDANAWTTDAEDLIVRRAEWDLYSFTVKDIESATAARAGEMEALAALQRETRLRRSVRELAMPMELGGWSRRPDIMTGY